MLKIHRLGRAIAAFGAACVTCDFVNNHACQTGNKSWAFCQRGLSKLIEREWVSHEDAEVTGSPTKFSVMTLNVLADGLGPATFIKVPAKALDFKFRGRLIVEALLQHEPDVICVQEMNRFPDVESALEDEGYSGFFAEKTRSPCVHFGYPADGCAIFIKNERFEAIEVERHEYVGMPQVFQSALLKDKANEQSVMVVTTHLKSKEPFEDVRVKEVGQLCEFVKKHENIPTIVAGDFNAVPHRDAIQLLKRETKMVDTYDFLSDVWTTWKIRKAGEVKRQIDYIFVSPSFLRVQKVLDLPFEEHVPAERFPNWLWPSDHLSLIAVVDYKDDALKRAPMLQ